MICNSTMINNQLASTTNQWLRMLIVIPQFKDIVSHGGHCYLVANKKQLLRMVNHDHRYSQWWRTRINNDFKRSTLLIIEMFHDGISLYYFGSEHLWRRGQPWQKDLAALWVRRVDRYLSSALSKRTAAYDQFQQAYGLQFHSHDLSIAQQPSKWWML